MLIINFGKFKTLAKFEMKKRCVGGVLGKFGRKRRSSEDRREGF